MDDRLISFYERKFLKIAIIAVIIALLSMRS